MPEMEVIKFLKNRAPYQAGETAGFSPHIAKRLVDAGFATPVKKRGRPKAKLAKPAPEPVAEEATVEEDTATEEQGDGEEANAEDEKNEEDKKEPEAAT